MKDKLQFGVFVNGRCKSYPTCERSVQLCWKRHHGGEFPVEKLMGAKFIKEYLKIAGVFDALEGK